MNVQPAKRRHPRWRAFGRVALGAFGLVVLFFLVVPFLLPFESLGTQTYREAAGADATFVSVDGVDVLTEFTPFTGADPIVPDSGVDDTQSAQNAPVFLLLHGFGASTFTWREVVDPLSELGDVVAYDRPAFGLTERPEEWGAENPYGYSFNAKIVNALIDRYAKDREVVLVGHSAGGQIAAAFAQQFPNRVQRLVLLDPAILTTGGLPSWLNWVLDGPQIDRLGPFFVQGIASSGLTLLNQSFVNPDLITDEVLDGYQRPLTIDGWEVALWEFTKSPRPTGVVDRLTDLTQPTLVITGESDTVVPVDNSKRVAQLLPNSTLVIIQDSAHLPHEEQPELCMQAIAQWMKS